MCEKMPAAQALDWGLVDELADDGRTVEKALEMAEVVLSPTDSSHDQGSGERYRLRTPLRDLLC
jgi:enoyl-CoA hydratase/carnithine racemase